MKILFQTEMLMRQGCPGYLFEEPDDILTDLRQPDNNIVHEDVIQGGVVSALPTGLRQNQVPAVHGGKEVLIFPRELWKKVNQKGQVNTSKRHTLLNECCEHPVSLACTQSLDSGCDLFSQLYQHCHCTQAPGPHQAPSQPLPKLGAMEDAIGEGTSLERERLLLILSTGTMNTAANPLQKGPLPPKTLCWV